MAKIVLKLDDDVSTDVIYPGRYMATVLPSETPAYCFADHEEFNQALRKGVIEGGSVILGGKNFGSGSSREQAASTLKGHDLRVVAKSFARIFLQNAVNLGLELVICPDVDGEVGDRMEIRDNEVVNLTRGETFKRIPLSPSRQRVLEAGGLVPYVRDRILSAPSGDGSATGP